MIKQLKFMFLVCCMFIFALLSGCASEDVIELNLAHFFPSTHPAETVLLTQWIDEIHQATDGQIKINVYGGGTLLEAPSIYGGVVDGIADMGLSCFAYTRGRFPVLEVFELPGVVYEHSKSASMTAWTAIQELDPPEIQDTKLLMVFATGPGDLFTKTPVTNLEDLRNMEIRATGVSVRVLELLGANPIAMDQGAAYEALSRGAISGNLSPIEVLKGWSHAEVTDYVTSTPFLYNTLFFININQQKWDSIPEDLQEIILDVTDRIYHETAIGLWDKQNQDALDWLINETDMELLDLEEGEQARWIQLVSPMLDDYKVAMVGRNQDGTAIVERVKELAQQYNEQYR